MLSAWRRRLSVSTKGNTLRKKPPGVDAESPSSPTSRTDPPPPYTLEDGVEQGALQPHVEKPAPGAEERALGDGAFRKTPTGIATARLPGDPRPLRRRRSPPPQLDLRLLRTRDSEAQLGRLYDAQLSAYLNGQAGCARSVFELGQRGDPRAEDDAVSLYSCFDLAGTSS